MWRPVASSEPSESSQAHIRLRKRVEGVFNSGGTKILSLDLQAVRNFALRGGYLNSGGLTGYPVDYPSSFDELGPYLGISDFIYVRMISSGFSTVKLQGPVMGMRTETGKIVLYSPPEIIEKMIELLLGSLALYIFDGGRRKYSLSYYEDRRFREWVRTDQCRSIQ